jgi:endoglycosylceramidase
MVTRLRLALPLGALLSGCGADPAFDEPEAGPPPPCAEPLQPGRPLGVRCGQLVDTDGRVAFLRGVNARVEGLFDVTFRDGRAPLEEIPAFDDTDAAAMRDLGFDALRLPVNWSGLEPTEDGGLDEAYLQRLEHTIDVASAAGMLVLVDFHQDAYSKEVGEDGAPLWAIEPPPSELLGGPLDDLEERRLSSQVLAAFETFFGTSADGERLRGRYVEMTTAVAERFSDHPGVFGFEIFNEPVTDSDGIARLDQLAYPAMRESAPDKLYVFEPPAVRNFLDSAPLAAAPLGPMTGYAPHVYSYALTADGPPETVTKELLRRSNENARIEADAWAAPLIVTEFGVNPDAPIAEQYLRWQGELQDEYMASSFFWLWKESSQGRWGCFEQTDAGWRVREHIRGALTNIRPARVSGWPRRFAYDNDTGELELSFWSLAEVAAPHWIAVSPSLGAVRAECDGREVDVTPVDVGVVEIACGPGDGRLHELRVARISP